MKKAISIVLFACMVIFIGWEVFQRISSSQEKGKGGRYAGFERRENMIQKKIPLSKKEAEGYIIPFGKANVVFAMTDKGMIGCGVFDVSVFDKFDYPAARVRSSSGDVIVTIDDLLAGIIKDVNDAAKKRGIELSMTGKEALELL